MKIYVGNLSKEVTDAQLTELGVPFGTLTSSRVVREHDGTASKGFAFLEYETAAEGNAAIAGLNGKLVGDQALKVNEAKNQRPKPLSRRY